MMKLDTKAEYDELVKPLAQMLDHDERPQQHEPFEPTNPGDPMALLPWMDDLAIGTTNAAPTAETARPRREAAPTRVADAAPPNRLPHQNWDGLTRATIQEHWAPNTVDLPKEVVDGLADAHRRTLKDGMEHGGNVLKSGGTKDRTSMKYTGGGSSHGFWPEPEKTDGKTRVGGYHTHPLDAGMTDDTFSDGDFSNMLDPGNRVSLQRAGDNIHMLARTKEFEKMMNAAEDLDEFGKQMEASYNAVYNKVIGKDQNDPQKRQAALEAATRATAEKYHLLYYSGRGAQLQRVAGGPKR